MPTFVLYIKAELENVARIHLAKGHRFCIDVKESAGQEEKKGVFVSAADEHELSGSKGTANFVMKFAKGAKEHSINVVEIKGLTRDYTADDDRQFVPIMGFECRGIEPTAFHPTDADWTVESTSGQKFEDVDLADLEWNDYDEKLGESVGILAFESKFEVQRGK